VNAATRHTARVIVPARVLTVTGCARAPAQRGFLRDTGITPLPALASDAASPARAAEAHDRSGSATVRMRRV
jgi:hypothetical protein